jgi:hypothetical protein
MFYWRITKYNPNHRRTDGSYSRHEWTSASDIGREFQDGVLTDEEYWRVETAYVQTIADFFVESKCPGLKLRDLEFNDMTILLNPNLPQVCLEPSTLKSGDIINDSSQLQEICRLILRDAIWCQIECDGCMRLDFDFDFYMFIGTQKQCSNAINSAVRRGLFVEPYQLKLDLYD